MIRSKAKEYRIGILGYSLLFFLILAFPDGLQAQGVLENPQPGSYQSGIGIVSGWKCTAGTITVSFDGGVLIQAAHGTSRGDTQSICGDTNNGFGLLWNWNLLGDGQHTVQVFADGVQFASANFTVTTLGVAFLTGASNTHTLNNFPRAGESVTLQWREGTQNFAIVGHSGTSVSVPNVAGTWSLSASFLSNTCSFISVPGTLPATLSARLFVSQTGASLTVSQGTSTLTGTVSSNSDFTIVTAPAISTPATGCTETVFIGESGNFLTGLALVIESVTLSGNCSGLQSCAITWVGTISKVSSATSALPTESLDTTLEDMRAFTEQAIEKRAHD